MIDLPSATLARLQGNEVTREFLTSDWLKSADDIDWAARQAPDSREFFLLNVLNVERPYPYQLEVMNKLMKYHRIAMYGPHGIGKTALMAWAVLYFMWAFPRNVKVITTASVWSQLSDYLWPEINLWGSQVAWSQWGLLLRPERELLKLKIDIRGEAKLATARSPREGREKEVEGAHADRVLWIFDEAKIVADPVWDAAEGAMATGAGYILAGSTPGDTVGRFWQICTRKAGLEDWKVRHVTKEEALAEGVLTLEYVEARRNQWEENQPADWHNRILGLFYESAPDALIPPHWVDLANQRHDELKKSGELKKIEHANTAFGGDIGEEGEDQSVLCKMTGDAVQWFRELSRAENPKVAATFAGWMHKDRGAPVAIDSIGVGSGVGSIMAKTEQFRVFRVKVSTKTKLRSRDGNTFVNLRSALWYLLREALDPQGEVLLALPRNDRLYQELTTPNWWFRSDVNSSIQVMNKENMKKKLKRSPDYAEALMFCWYAMLLRNRSKMKMA